MRAHDIINYLSESNKSKYYLEIGVRQGHTLQKIKIDNKTGVDPLPQPEGEKYTTHVMSSDDFFKQNEQVFDLIFVDGFHESEQVYRDITNSLKVLSLEGYIVCHDMNPPTEMHQKSPQPKEAKEWNGDCWKAWVKLRSLRSDLKMFVVDTDFGCGVITRGQQKLVDIDKVELSWDNFLLHKKEWLNLIPDDDGIVATMANHRDRLIYPYTWDG